MISSNLVSLIKSLDLLAKFTSKEKPLMCDTVAKKEYQKYVIERHKRLIKMGLTSNCGELQRHWKEDEREFALE